MILNNCRSPLKCGVIVLHLYYSTFSLKPKYRCLFSVMICLKRLYTSLSSVQQCKCGYLKLAILWHQYCATLCITWCQILSRDEFWEPFVDFHLCPVKVYEQSLTSSWIINGNMALKVKSITNICRKCHTLHCVLSH